MTEQGPTPGHAPRPGGYPPSPPPGPGYAGPVPQHGQGYPPAPQGYAYPAPPAAPGYPSPPPKPPVLADGAEYHLALTGPGQAWWRPLVSFLVVLVGGFALVMGFSVLLLVVLLVQSGGNLDEALTGPEAFDMSDPWIFTIQNLMLSALIPLAGLTTWLVHQVRPGFVSSVIGRFRWGWALWCLTLLIPLWGTYVAVVSMLMPGSAAGGGAGDGANRPEHWVLLLVLMLVTTPLQSAGEEYLFRGWIMQQMGALFRHRWVALAVSIVLSSLLFALAHMSLDPWVLLDLAGMATAMVLITWRTGGLEAAVVLHAVNNLVAIGYAILFGDLAGSFIEPDTTSTWQATLVSWVAVAVATGALWLLARWRGVERRVVPRGSSVGPGREVAATDRHQAGS